MELQEALLELFWDSFLDDLMDVPRVLVKEEVPSIIAFGGAPRLFPNLVAHVNAHCCPHLNHFLKLRLVGWDILLDMFYIYSFLF